MKRFRATAEGVVVDLPAGEITILARLGNLLGGVEDGDPAHERLYPKLYPNDPAASRDFQRLVSKERVEAQSEDRELFVDSLRAAESGLITLSGAAAAAWARVIGEARIVLAARTGLFESGMPESLPQDPEVGLVMLLGYLQDELVGELLKTMEDPT